jgi:hypothetical protein
MAAMLALSAGTAMADVLDDDVFFRNADFDDVVDDDGFDDVLLLDEGTATFDELCSPGLPDSFFIPGCIFSDVEEDDDFDFVDIDDDDFLDDADIVFVVDDDIFDNDNGNDRDGRRQHRNR